MTRTGALVALGLAVGASPGWASQSPDSAFTLVTAVVRALEVHPTVRAADASQQRARANVGEFTAGRFPALSLDGSVIRFQEPMLVAPIHALDAAQIQFDRTLIQGALRLGYTIWDGGARGSSIDAARTRETVAASQYDLTTMDLVIDVATSYLSVLSATEMLAAHDEGLAALGAERDRVERLLAEGAVAQIEVLRVDAALADANAARSAVAIELDNARQALARSLELDVDEIPTPPTPVALRDVAPPQRDTVRLLAGTSNPELALAQQAIEAARWERKAATSGWHPRLDVIGGLLMFASGSGHFTTEWQAGVQLSYPLFLGGRRSRSVDAASANLSAAEYRFQSAELRLEETVDHVVGTARELRARVVALTASVGHLEEIARIERLSLEVGSGIQAEYLRAQANLREARARLAQVRHTEIAARLELARLTGQLDVAWLEGALENTP